MKETWKERKEGRKHEVKPNLSKNKDRKSGRTNKKLFKLKRQSQQIKRSYCRYNIKCLGLTEIAEFL